MRIASSSQNSSMPLTLSTSLRQVRMPSPFTHQ
uniref:Uncharacterized protein n=1 Tax=Human herpesvirus 2 TaxID=10310 RepID=A0A481TI13_HHV2|nr:hypothetical protein [Human alphaherpesvirus 2]